MAYFIKHLKTNEGGIINVYPAFVEEKTIHIDSGTKGVYIWADNGDNIPEENELIPDSREEYFGLVSPPRYLPKISKRNCA